jgi:biotin carboxyl carrier protein
MRKFNVTVNGKQYMVEVEEVGAGVAGAQPIPVATAAPAAPVAPAPQAAAVGTKVVAPMPGLVLGFKVENGATVKKDQAIMILEAMKMENDIVAPCDGVVTFQTQKGTNVDTGAVLAIIG